MAEHVRRHALRRVGGALVVCGLLAAGIDARQLSSPDTQHVEVDGLRMRVLVSGLDRRRPGNPVVVFEAGATHSLETWARVLPEVAAFAPVVAYDRSGLGQSVWDKEAPTPQHVTRRLRRLLQQVGAAPPYVLVGHSWGGVLARYFAGHYPQEVVGLVYVDPGPMVTQSLDEELAPFRAIGAGRSEYDALWSAYRGIFDRASPAVRAEFEVYRSLMHREVKDRDLKPVPDVPVAVIVAAKPLPAFLTLPFDQRAHFQADLRHRIRVLQEWALASPRGTLVVSNATTHAVTREQPDVIVWAVRQVLPPVR